MLVKLSKKCSDDEYLYVNLFLYRNSIDSSIIDENKKENDLNSGTKINTFNLVYLKFLFSQDCAVIYISVDMDITCLPDSLVESSEILDFLHAFQNHNSSSPKPGYHQILA